MLRVSGSPVAWHSVLLWRICPAMLTARSHIGIAVCRAAGLLGPVYLVYFLFFQAEDGIRATSVTGVQTCALPIYTPEQTAGN